VSFLALLVPSRENLEEYQDYAEQVRVAIERVNRRFGTAHWRPVTAVYGNDHPRALACMQHYDVLLVNPLVDGMNLVAKEGGLLNRRQGTIVLSKTAGAHEQLQGGVLGIEPGDLLATAGALYRALTLPPEVRTKLAARVKDILLEEDAGRWLSRQCNDLFHFTAQRRQYPAPKLMSFPRHYTGKDKAKVNEFRPLAKTLPLTPRQRLSSSSDPA
jgi:trehalose 6-phosphate synthase